MAHNALIQSIVTQQNWSLNGIIEFKTTSQIKALIKSRDASHSLLHSGFHVKSQRTNANLVTYYNVYTYAAFLIEDANSIGNETLKKEVFSVSLRNNYLSQTDLKILFRIFSNYIEMSIKGGGKSDLYNIDVNLEAIQHEVLLIDKQSVDATEAAIKAEYPYPFKIVDREEIDKAINTADSKSFFPMLIWSDAHNYYLFITVNAGTGLLQSKMGVGGVHAAVGATYRYTNTFQTLYSYNSYLDLSPQIIGTIAGKGAQKVNNFLK
ncbi:MAG: hypothetical protein H7282_05450 [Cytophagaceae bacterium]|nr:hypothetical protein [Cytophagaceae bacterium]